ncbi:PaaI family thioesterase [Halocynthiibacter styelae]|uniref:Medium/long-chain acyl-CoA thioesterase YigI n=1 Tax=Halocynthiibacter styelae TaxID=2761955 RepID=A0A8J7LKU2_9RHOB|nr:PaaI family thioesterase [Paenihalocynthiibacter styelae]MBI1493314.1 PaaI family thioesterase [Paenihalocynthiibacter styelae]
MTDILKMGQTILALQPFSKSLGAELTELGDGKAVIELPLQEDHKQQHGFAHGGVVSYLADNALTFAAGSLLGDVLTLEMKINYIRPAKGALLISRAQVLSHGKRQAVCEAKVYAVENGEEKICGIAQGTVMPVS